MKIQTSIEEISHNYEGFIVDLWGVVHDGHSLYPKAFKTLTYLNPKRVVFLSNTSSRASVAAEMLRRFGICDDMYCNILTAGEYAYQLCYTGEIKNYITTNTNYYVNIGPYGYSSLLNSLELKQTDDFNKASFVLLTGFCDSQCNMQQMMDSFMPALEKGLLMLCVNPDKTSVTQQGKVNLCPGLIAEQYQKLGGRVLYCGKPCLDLYKQAFEMLNLPKSKILAIGDGLETDILGANNAGIDSALVTGGLLKSQVLNGDRLDTSELTKLCTQAQATPTYVLSYFA